MKKGNFAVLEALTKIIKQKLKKKVSLLSKEVDAFTVLSLD